jgi:hypothetical protein
LFRNKEKEMKHFPILRTQRLTVQLRELSIGQSVNLAGIPDHTFETACTAFLRAAVESVQGVEDPLHWTVQERCFGVAHYLACVTDDDPDFSLGAGKFTDYLEAETDHYVDQVEIGEIAGDHWQIRQLTGAMAESIERLVGELDAPGRLHWLLGAMAAQLVRKNEDMPELESESAYDQWLLNRMRVFGAFPDSDFELLMGAYLAGLDSLHHLFAIHFDDRGIVVLPRKGADGSLPPARFPVLSCLSKTARALAGKHDQSGGESDAVHSDIGD